jgi:phage shock protein PspC (stress-responsive transcriptional regulator)
MLSFRADGLPARELRVARKDTWTTPSPLLDDRRALVDDGSHREHTVSMSDQPQSPTSPIGPTDTATPPAGPGAPSGTARFFDAIRSTGIVRGSDRWFAGVCGGLAHRAGLNPTLVRVVAIVLAILGGPVLFVYAVGWALLPDQTGRIHAEQALRGVFEPVMIGIVVVLAISFASSSRDLWWQNPPAGLPAWLAATLAVGWSIGVTIGIIWLVVFLARRTSAPPSTYRRWDPATDAATPAPASAWRDRRPGAGFTAIVLGLALLAGAISAGVWSAGVWSDAALLVGLAVALGVLALGIIVCGIRGREGGALGGLAFLTAVALLVLGVFPTGTQFFPLGAPVWTVGPVAASAPPGYVVLAGKSTIDLSGLDDGHGAEARTIDVWMGLGVTELVLPTGRPVRVEAHAMIGGIDYSGADDRGGIFFQDSRTFNGSDARVVPRIRVWTFIGQVTIVGAGSQEPS